MAIDRLPLPWIRVEQVPADDKEVNKKRYDTSVISIASIFYRSQ